MFRHFLLFPGIRIQQYFLNTAAPNGLIAACNEPGSMNAETFIKWLKQFLAYGRSTNENAILVLMDNHSPHVTARKSH